MPYKTQFPEFRELPYEQVLIRNFSNEMQMREDFIFFFLLEGSLRVQLYEKTFHLSTHDIFFLKPQEIHSVLDTSSDIHVLALFLEERYLNFLCPDIHEIDFEKHHIRYSQSDPIYSNICSHLAEIILHTLKKGSTTQLRLLSAVSAILTCLLDAYGSKQLNHPSASSYIHQQIASLLEYLNHAYQEPVTLSSAAQVLGFHPQYFSAFFKKHFRMTFIEYLTMLRVNKTLSPLANTDTTITDIAISHGFSSHKTYSVAFRKLYGMTPSEYRKEHLLQIPDTLPESQNPDYFSFFQKYWQSDSLSKENVRSIQNHITLSLTQEPKQSALQCFPKKHCISVGRAFSVLRSDIQEQIREAKQELSISIVRIRDIFSDDLFVYYENEEKQPVINWKYIDTIFDFLLDLGLKPFPEIGFMPRDLASKKQYAGWLNRPNVSIPKSFKKWSTLVTSFLRHLIRRYGRTEVLTWKFDFWTTANLRFKDGYWNESKEDFFLFYRVTYFSIKNVDAAIQLGSPNFSLPSGLDWYSDFFTYCKEYGMEPSYVSTHLYNCPDQITSNAENFTRFSNSWDNLELLSATKDTALENVTRLYRLMEQHHWEKQNIVVSDWNLSFFPRDLVRDTSFMAPYMLYTSIQTRNMADLLCFRSLSDINEDFFVDRKPFRGGPGLMDFNGLKKSSWYALSFLQKMGPDLLDAGENFLLTKSDKGFQLLLFHYVYYDSLYAIDDHSSLSYRQRYNIYESSEELVIHSLLQAPEGSYRVKQTRINRQHGSAYDAWLQMGAPEELEPDMISYLKQRNCPDIVYSIQECTGHLLFDTVLQPHSVVLLEITPLIEEDAFDSLNETTIT